MITGIFNYPCPGLYSAIFFIYMQCQTSEEFSIKKRNVLLYALSVLYILSSATIVLDVTELTVSKIFIHHNSLFFTLLIFGQDWYPTTSLVPGFRLDYASQTIIGLCDFISQAILVRINSNHLLFIHLKFQRYTDAGSYGVVTSIS